MTDDELTEAVVQPIRELLDRMMSLIEGLTNRVEVLELEMQHHRPSTPNNPPTDAAPGDPSV